MANNDYMVFYVKSCLDARNKTMQMIMQEIIDNKDNPEVVGMLKRVHDCLNDIPEYKGKDAGK